MYVSNVFSPRAMEPDWFSLSAKLLIIVLQGYVKMYDLLAKTYKNADFMPANGRKRIENLLSFPKQMLHVVL